MRIRNSSRLGVLPNVERAMLIVVLTIDNQSYFPSNLFFLHYFFIHRDHVKNFGTLLDMLVSDDSVHEDKRLGTG